MKAEELQNLSDKIVYSSGIVFALGEVEAEKLLAYTDLLSRWSKKMSLVSSGTPERIINEHILDSVAAFGTLTEIVSRETVFLDIGSGAGLPGVVFSVLAPENEITLLEPRAKRVDFLKEAKRVLGLKNVVVECARLEDFKSDRPMVHGVQRAVGREIAAFNLLKEKFNQFTLSLIVSSNWQLPTDLNHSQINLNSYTLPSGRTASVHSLSCFT